MRDPIRGVPAMEGTMSSSTSSPRKAVIVAPTEGRAHAMGRMRAVFKADGVETDLRYSISEWWLEPNKGPGNAFSPRRSQSRKSTLWVHESECSRRIRIEHACDCAMV